MSRLMHGSDVNSLFARAEQAFVAGRLDAARADLAQVQRLAGDHPAVLHLLALVEKKRGALDAARAAFERALRLAPNDPEINNNYANLLDALGHPEAALSCYDRVLEAAPQFDQARYNRALLLQRLGRLKDALAELDWVPTARPESAKAHSARATILRKMGRLGEAAEAYEAALRLEPRRVVALHGRARVAMERGEPQASLFYRRALQQRPEDLTLRLGLAEALEAEGDPESIQILATAVSSHPQWAEGQAALARMRWEAGEEKSFTRDLEAALKTCPGDRGLWLTYASSLAEANFSAEAADAAAKARAVLGEDPGLQLLEAVHAGEAGESERADRLFASLPADLPGASLHEVRHRLRQKDFARALRLAETARLEAPWDVGAWALTGLLWRLVGDERAEWLHGQEGLMSVQDLGLTASEIAGIADRLRSFHRTRAQPLGQSLRGGTQTRGRLFERQEPAVLLLREAIVAAVQRHWNGLPSVDLSHPLLRHRNETPRLAGSWSVRLTEGGFHIAHVHPHGVLSSASYLVVPESQADREGWLEIGRPPTELGLDLEPLLVVEPKPGSLALFPSTLFHGTRPFSAGERITAAFDIVPA